MPVVAQPVGRPLPVNRDLASRPEHRRAAHAGLVRGNPRRFGLVPPEGIERLLGIAEAERHVGTPRVDHIVADDPVGVGALAGDHRIMIGKGLGREGRTQLSMRALGGEAREVGGDASIQIVGAKAVDRDQDGDGLAGILLRLRGEGKEEREQQR